MNTIANYLSSLLVATLITASPVQASEPIRLLAGTPYTPASNGWFFDDAQQSKVMARLVEADHIEAMLKLNEALVEDYKALSAKQIELTELYKRSFLEENEKLTKVLIERSRSNWLYFTLGIVVAIGAGAAFTLAAQSR